MKEAFEKMTGMPDAWTNPALMVSRNAFIQGWEMCLMRQKQERVQTDSLADIGAAYKDIHACLTETLQLSRKQNGHSRQPTQEPVSVTYKEVADAMNSLWNGTLEQHQIAEQMANKKLYTTPAQPAQQEHDVDATIIQYHEATIKRLEKRIEDLTQPAQEPWCMKMNGCKTKCADCPDEPAQEPVAWMDEEKKVIYWHNTHATDDYHGFKRSTPLYTAPQQRPWVGLTEAQFLEATRLAENGNYLVAFVRIQEWLKEQNT